MRMRGMKQNEGGKEHKEWGVNVEQRFHFRLVSSAHLSGTFEKNKIKIMVNLASNPLFELFFILIHVKIVNF